MFHNPQNLTLPEGSGFRFLTTSEVEVLTDRTATKTSIVQELLRNLALEYWNQSRCEWRSNLERGTPFNLENLTYRTLAPLPQIPAVSDYVEKWHDSPPSSQFAAACADFVESFEFLSAEHHSRMREKGFWRIEDELSALLGATDRKDLLPALLNAFDGQKIALQTSEASEALEGLRHGNPPDDKIPEFSAAEAEFADIILRLMDHAHARGWRVAAALIAKMSMNATRDKMHGKAF
jgi:hypothetical protein